MKLFAKKTGEHKLQIVSPNAPFQYVEAYKALRTNLNFMAVGNEYKKIVVTSSIPEEGKSNVATNLAVTLGEDGKKVLLVDCDMRKSMLHKYLRISRHTHGLTTVLSGEATFDDCVISFQDLKIDVLTAGAVPPNPAELLGSEKMGALIKQIEGQYDYIVFDAPPISIVTDAAVLARWADGALLVVRQNFVSLELVKRSKQILDNLNVKIIGTVFNAFDMRYAAKDGNYYYDYNYKYEAT